MLPDGSVTVADTYNGAVRRYDAGREHPGPRGLEEPSDVLVDGPDPEHVRGADAARRGLLGGHLVVVESAAHLLVRVPLPARLRAPAGPPRVTAEVAPGPVTLRVVVSLPEAQHVDHRFGDPPR